MGINHKLRLCMSSVALAVLAPAGSLAQTVPSAADPVKAADRFQSDPFARPPEDPLAIEAIAPTAAEAEATFILGGIVFSGVTVYPESELAALFASYIGKPVTVTEMQKQIAQISKRYQDDGYALAVAYLPTQTVNDGSTLTIHVSEGRIGTVTFQGDTPPESVHQLFLRHIEKIRNERPVRTETLERYLLLINDLPGTTARAVMRPSASDEGATDLILYYLHKPYDVIATTDNRGSRYLGPWQHTLSAAGNSLLGMEERISVRTITTSPTQELRYVDLHYEQPINTRGTKVVAITSYAKTLPGESLKASHVEANSADVQVSLIHPFLRTRLQNLHGHLTFDVRNSITDLAHANLTDDRVRSIRLGASYDRTGNESATLVNTELSRGIAGLGATEDGAGRSITSADHDYTKVTLDVSHTHMLDEAFSLLLTGSGQYAFNTLLSSEQYLVGGPAYGTAYDPGEMAGDHGLAGKVELRYGQALEDPLVQAYHVYGFYDVGMIWRKSPLTTEASRDSLASAGAGIGVEFGEHIAGNLEVAFPLTKRLSADTDNDGRIFSSLTARY